MWLASERRRVNNTSLLLLLLIASHAFGQVNSSTSSTSTTHDVAKPLSSITSAEPTCEFRTVNYITHTLPQQCLTSGPSSFSTPASISATVTSSSSIPVDSTAGADDAIHHQELDADGNDLSTGAFMSFEEWKAMMLEKSGQDALEPRQRKSKETQGEADPGEDFDSLGDEGEVSLDFDAYSDKISEIASSTKPSQKEKEKEKQVEKVNYDEGLAQGYRSKDAGKTSKERLSYASFDAGATVKKASPGAKNPKAILVENKDSYMLLECAMQNKFVIIELSDDILVDTVVIANFEFFSSMIRHFRVSVSDRYPVKLEKWKVLGIFEARNSRDIQPFLVENPQIWAKYLRIEILSHYGNEYYCPMSLLRVHGTRMLDSWKEADPADIEPEEDKAISEPPEETVEETEVPVEEVEVAAEPIHHEDQVIHLYPEQSCFIPYWDKHYFYHYYPNNATCGATGADDYMSQRSKENEKIKTAAKPQPLRTVEQTISISSSPSSVVTPTSPSASQVTPKSIRSAYPSSSSQTAASTALANSTESTPVSTPSPDPRSATVTPTTTTATSTTITSPNLSKTASVQSPPKSKTSASTSVIKPPSSRAAASKSQPSGSPTTPRNKTTTSTSSAAPAPTVQDSFFKALNKRIQALESNTTLSLQYIESQSRFLREALARLEKRQVAKVDLFLDTLNKTVFGELREVRVQYDQIWQSTVIALETQREQSEREIVALSSRLGVLADEVIFQKRMAIVQSVLLLGCLLLIIFSRGGLAQAATESSYYPAQFFGGGGGGGGSSRLASPLFPSTPRTHRRDVTPLLSPGVDSPAPSTPQRHIITQTPDSSSSSLHHHHRPRRMSGSSSSRPAVAAVAAVVNVNVNDTPESTVSHRIPSSPDRTSSKPPSGSFFRAPTPPGVDAGYDSEPAMAPSREREGKGEGEYYSAAAVDSGKSTALSYQEVLARKSERQLTPSSETDGAEYIPPPLSSRPPLTHSTSAQKPLPTLPEDPD
ncbi:UNC-like C-terminal-domain-containing protein [Daldinia caldariorum]|uniref:UNC-like C-terminal-domain-containing protein n=1 Tax=Daldinia caldariorum TaxID=326644 RepID=UPI002007F2BC|nr:UNC-like C-terminal-domain-containing protein [Daldinia caldariorum]KAI1464746.1 UNC-like C-terminal-domain-containing protein [Daldinia caldariorum]